MSITYKTIGFQPKLIPEILAYRKTSTIRLAQNMRHHIEAGDIVLLLDSFQRKPFALAEITLVEQKTYSALSEEDSSTAQIPSTFEEFKQMMEVFYSDPISEETVWSIIHFRIIDDGQKTGALDMLQHVSQEESTTDTKNEQ